MGRAARCGAVPLTAGRGGARTGRAAARGRAGRIGGELGGHGAMGEAPEGAAEAPGAWRRKAAQGGRVWGAWRDARRCHSRRGKAGQGRPGPGGAEAQGTHLSRRAPERQPRPNPRRSPFADCSRRLCSPRTHAPTCPCSRLPTALHPRRADALAARRYRRGPSAAVAVAAAVARSTPLTARRRCHSRARVGQGTERHRAISEGRAGSTHLRRGFHTTRAR